MDAVDARVKRILLQGAYDAHVGRGWRDVDDDVPVKSNEERTASPEVARPSSTAKG